MMHTQSNLLGVTGYNHCMDLPQIELRAKEALASTDDGLVAVYLFGSVARATASATSDIDVGILFRTPPPGRLNDVRFNLEGMLERTLGQTVQVVVLNNAPPDLIHRVLRDGRLLIERDRAARIRFEVRARNEYFDLLPTLNRYRRRETAAP